MKYPIHDRKMALLFANCTPNQRQKCYEEFEEWCEDWGRDPQTSFDDWLWAQYQAGEQAAYEAAYDL